MKVRTYSELMQIDSFIDRYRYLALSGTVGESTFGFYRWMNQSFYRSKEWQDLRHHIIARDMGCDLGYPEREIHGGRLYIHHMNPMTKQQLERGDPNILNPSYLIVCTHDTHNAIHYGNEHMLRKPFKARAAGDTRLW